MPENGHSQSSTPKQADRWHRLWAAGEMLGLAGIATAMESTRRLTRKQQNGTLGQPTHEPEDESMLLNLGDVTITQQQARGGLSRAAKAGLMAAALAGSGGLGAGGIALLDHLTQPTAAAQPDSDTTYRVEVEAE